MKQVIPCNISSFVKAASSIKYLSLQDLTSRVIPFLSETVCVFGSMVTIKNFFTRFRVSYLGLHVQEFLAYVLS